MNLEAELLKKLIDVYQPQQAVDIYHNFCFKYKQKHIGEVILNPKIKNEWCQHRGEVFARYLTRYYLPNERKHG